METVTSPDGTSIAYERHGDGHPLVCVHGGSVTRRSWDPLAARLEDEFSLIVPDRRGRGESGDADGYSLDREVADLCTVLDAVDGEATVFGHSFGGLVAVAATAACDLDRLLLYEPVVLGDTHGVDLAARMRDRLADGEREAAMERFYSDGAGVPAPERLPIWPERIRFDLVETVIREQHAVEAYRLSQVPPVDTPTLLLTGEHSPEYLQSSVQSLADRITKSTVTTLDGVGHLGIQSDPGQIATAIRTFHPKTAHTVGYST